MRKLIFGFVVASLPVVAANAQTVAAGTNASLTLPATIEPATCCVIPALTEVQIEIGSTINSQANQIGEHFPIRLVGPIIVDGKVLVPEGAKGEGDIVHAAKSRFGGRAGELILVVRYLEHGGVRIPLRSLRYLPGHGKTNEGKAMAAAIVVGGAVGATIGMFITGGEVNVPAGTKALAKTSASVVIPPVSTPNPVPQPEGNVRP